MVGELFAILPTLCVVSHLLNRGLRPKILLTLWLQAGLGLCSGNAEPNSPLREDSPTPKPVDQYLEQEWSLVEKLDDLGLLYENDGDSTIQEAWVLGRYHGQLYRASGPSSHADAFETRRFRLGSQLRAFQRLTLHAQAISGSDLNPAYNGFTELWGQWSFAPEVAIVVGQQKNRFTHDRNVSSRYLATLERAMLTNMFGADYTPAVTIQSKVNAITYYTGLFSNATGQNIAEAFTELNSGYSFLSAVYYELVGVSPGSGLGFDSASLYGSYVHSEASDRATNFNRFDKGLSTALILTKGGTAITTEVTAGLGAGSGNAVGLNLQPSYFFTPTTQVTTRYQLASSNKSDGLLPQQRYEGEVGIGPGSLYQAGYIGLNYFLLGHRLKLMTGLEYANMSGHESWTASTMIRLYFGPHSGGAFPMNKILPLDHD